jgi:hypothetical protein
VSEAPTFWGPWATVRLDHPRFDPDPAAGAGVEELNDVVIRSVCLVSQLALWHYLHDNPRVRQANNVQAAADNFVI